MSLLEKIDNHPSRLTLLSLWMETEDGKSHGLERAEGHKEGVVSSEK